VTAPEASDNITEARGDEPIAAAAGHGNDLSATQHLKTIYVICAAIICGVTFYFNKVTFENSFQRYRSTIELHRLEPLAPDAEADRELMRRSQDANLGSSAAVFLALLVLGQYLLTRAETQKKKLAQALLQLKSSERKATLEGEDAELTAAFNNLAASLAELDSGHRQWVADTSHELRTPIAVLRAQVEAFQDGIQELTPRNLAVLHSEIMALSKLVDDLHWLAKYDVGQIKTTSVPVDLNQTLQDVLESFEERREAKEIKLENLVPAEEKLIVIADASRLRQVLTNLTENSLRYTNKGGTLRISRVLNVVNQPLLKLYFDDTEPGVPDELLPRLFDRFFRVESSRARTMGGSGLGLAICLNNMQMLGGKIEASHSSMGGLRIELTLPMVEAHT
jgi:signal transduction histidine kinase